MIIPMLAETVKGIPKNLNDFCVEQKFDGKRLLAHVVDREVTGYNRKGNPTVVPVNVAAAFDNKGFEGDWLFDGEIMADGQYVIFDILTAKGNDLIPRPQGYRREFLEMIGEKINNPNIIIPPIRKGRFIEGFVNECMDRKAEGVIFKDVTAPYRPGKRSRNFLKYKFTKAIDVVVMETNRKDKDQAVTVGLFRNSDLIEVGGCKLPEHVVGSIVVGDVLEIEYLYGTENYHVYQPVFLRLRDDKDPFECVLEQLIQTNKEVLTLENR